MSTDRSITSDLIKCSVCGKCFPLPKCRQAYGRPVCIDCSADTTMRAPALPPPPLPRPSGIARPPSLPGVRGARGTHAAVPPPLVEESLLCPECNRMIPIPQMDMSGICKQCARRQLSSNPSPIPFQAPHVHGEVKPNRRLILACEVTVLALVLCLAGYMYRKHRHQQYVDSVGLVVVELRYTHHAFFEGRQWTNGDLATIAKKLAQLDEAFKRCEGSISSLGMNARQSWLALTECCSQYRYAYDCQRKSMVSDSFVQSYYQAAAKESVAIADRAFIEAEILLDKGK